MGGGVDVESEAGGVEHEHRQPEDSDDVIGPPLPPGYNVRVIPYSGKFSYGANFRTFHMCLLCTKIIKTTKI